MFSMESAGINCDQTAALTYQVHRSVFSAASFQEHLHKKEKKRIPTSERLLQHFRCSVTRTKLVLLGFIPILQWLPTYSVKDNLFGDIISGLSTGVMQLPQGLAYALLAGVPPVFGLYSSFYPVILYLFFGSSRHVSVGSFAVICLMTGSVVLRLAPDELFEISALNATNSSEMLQNIKARDEMRVKVASAVTFLSGIMQFSMGLLRFGFVAIYLAEPLVRGFTTAAAIHVFLSQIKYFLGISTQRFNGPLSSVYKLISVVSKVKETNITALIVGMICVIVLFAGKEINDRFKSRLRVPIPMELIVVVISTGISAGCNMTQKYGLAIVGKVPTGLRAPVIPDFRLLSEIYKDCFAIAIVGFSMNISLAKMFALKHGYSISGNQEMIALGVCNSIGSFFQTFPITASMSRSLVQESTGGNTQIAGGIGSAIVLLVILAIGSLFAPLPQAALAAIVMVNLKGIFKQFQDLPLLWRTSKLEFLTWIVAFIASLLLGLDLGLLVAVTFALILVVYRTQRPQYRILGQVPNTDIYWNIEDYEEIREVPGIKIFQSNSSIYFANSELYMDVLREKTGIDPIAISSAKKILAAKNKERIKKTQRKKKKGKITMNEAVMVIEPQIEAQETSNIEIQNGSTVIRPMEFETEYTEEMESLFKTIADVHSIILDFSSVNFVDSVSVKALKSMMKKYEEIGINVYIASCNGSVIAELTRLQFFGKSITTDLVFHRVHDAVLFCQRKAACLENPPL
ncbi:prestin [Callorhinchus milii]|uniref:prestin n=1 Tax=Callorhinchus milii TaxID=7868 RepID=UPI00045712F3|nr:prestin [Callorhinchus milii]|eukprot:gi/632947504/ref/XP_007889078.1/ PREDICTED: prestin [Callorhinchus milii]